MFEVLSAAMDVYRAPYVSLVLTAPGSSVLPAGMGGVVDEVARRRWMVGAADRYRKLHARARNRAARGVGRPPLVLARVWEPQRRLAPHAHLLLGGHDDDHLDAARAYGRELAALSREYEFGRVFGYGIDGNERVYESGRSAARYLASYFLDEAHGKRSLTEAVRRGWLPQLPVWVNPALTRRSGVTRGKLVKARQVRAYRMGYTDRCPRFWRGDALQDRDNRDIWRYLGGIDGARAQRAKGDARRARPASAA
jgi:hypothetical protein